jgi:hypothetical protein
MAIEETLGKEVFLDSMGLGGRDRETRVSLEKQLIEDRAQLETLLEYYGDSHPKVIERRKKIGQVEAYLRQSHGFGDGPLLGERGQLTQRIGVGGVCTRRQRQHAEREQRKDPQGLEFHGVQSITG